jgi:predicted lipoprotein with Yx(FWY)xxD motif
MNTRKMLSGLLVAGVVLTACGSDDDASDDAASAATVSEDTTTSGDEATPAGSATVMVATDPTIGDHLVDAEGRTLYLFAKDEGTTTACTGGCADNWPPIIADGEPTAGEGVDTALLGTADGIEPNQVTYNGHLLYYFAGDQAAGDTNGVGLPDWYAVDPAGDAIP